MTTTSTTNKPQLKPLAKIPKLLPSHIPVTDDDTVTCAICLEDSDECNLRFVKKRVETSCLTIFIGFVWISGVTHIQEVGRMV